MASRVVVHRDRLRDLKFKIDQKVAVKAAKIEIKAKAYVPELTGGLQSSGRHMRIGFARFRIEFNKEYAAYQHRGMRADGSHVVKNYSSPGTGKLFLSRAAGEVGREEMGSVT